MKHFINLKDIPAKDLRRILIDAKKRKKARKKLNNLDHDKGMPLKGKLLIQMFEKSSLRTRLSFFLAISQLSGRTLTLRPDELHLSKGGESIEDTAKILSNFGDAFMLRTDNDEKLEEFKKHLTIPIINGLSPSSHPTQILSDVFTIEEIKKNKNKITIYNDPKKAVEGADVIFSDKVISMNDKVNKKRKLRDFKNFKISKNLMKKCPRAIFLHCLPRGSEVDENVFKSKQSKVWLQALNRVHVQKSILLYCLGKLR